MKEENKKPRAGRPIEKNLKYFPVEVGMSDDYKILLAEEMMGELADYVFGVSVKILKWIYGREGYYMEWTQATAIAFTKKEFNFLKSADVIKIVDCLLETGFFHRELYIKYKILTSRGIQNRWSGIIDLLKRKAKIDLIHDINNFIEPINSGINSEINELNSSINTFNNSEHSEIDKNLHPPGQNGNNSINPIINTGSNSLNEEENEAESEKTTQSKVNKSKLYLLNKAGINSGGNSGEEIPPVAAAPPSENTESLSLGACWNEIFNRPGHEEYIYTLCFANSLMKKDKPDIEALKNWASSFNRFLLKQRKQTIYLKNWKDHFHNWLPKQPLKVDPTELNKLTGSELGIKMLIPDGKSASDQELKDFYKPNKNEK